MSSSVSELEERYREQLPRINLRGNSMDCNVLSEAERALAEARRQYQDADDAKEQAERRLLTPEQGARAEDPHTALKERREALSDASSKLDRAKEIHAAALAGPDPADLIAARQGEASATEKKLARNSLLGAAGVGLIVGIAVRLVAGFGTDLGAYCLAALFVVGVLTLLALLHWSEGGFLRVLRGGDGRLSTSYAQAGLWTLLLVFTFALFTARAAVKSNMAIVTSLTDLDPIYLILLGGPFAAVVGAKAAYAAKMSTGTIQKAEADGIQAKDLLADDSGRASLNDAQFVVFNLVAALTFCVLLAENPNSLPVMPVTLVGLTGLSALAYVTTKAVTNQQPVISSIVTPTGVARTLSSGSIAEIRGYNFVVPGADRAEDRSQVRVRFGTYETGVEGIRPDGQLNPTATSIYVLIPPVVGGDVDVEVVTATGTASNKYRVTVSARAT